MFVFYKLCLGHLIADFILQFEELYRLKLRSVLGHSAHAVIHGLCYALLLAPYLSKPRIVILLAVLTAIHYYQDRIKYSLQEKYPRQIFACFTIDQILHFLFLGSVLLLPEGRVEPAFSQMGRLETLYLSSKATLLLSGFIAAGFASGYFLHALRKSYVPGTRPDHFITSFEMAHGLLERGWIFLVFTFAAEPGQLFFALPVGLLRLLRAPLKSPLDFALAFAVSALLGLFFRRWF